MIALTDTEPLFDRSDLSTPAKRREDAVVELERWLSHRSDRPIDKLYTACFATRLSPIALTHFDVLAKMTNTEPESLLWYSFISGLLSSEPSGQVIERMLFKLSRDFDADVQNLCGDIALDELEVLTQSDGSIAPWIGIGAGFVSVELKMGVCASFRLRDRTTGGAVAGRAQKEPGHDKQMFDELLEQLRTLYHRKGDLVQKKRRRK